MHQTEQGPILTVSWYKPAEIHDDQVIRPSGQNIWLYSGNDL